MSYARSSGETFVRGIISLVVVCVVLLPSYLVIVGGVASTIVGWVPQPSIGTVVYAFQFYLVVSIGLKLITLVFSVDSIPSIGVAVVFGGIIAVFGVPLLYLLFHAAVSVWTALPDSYDAQVSFLFLLASLVGHITANSDD